MLNSIAMKLLSFTLFALFSACAFAQQNPWEKPVTPQRQAALPSDNSTAPAAMHLEWKPLTKVSFALYASSPVKRFKLDKFRQRFHITASSPVSAALVTPEQLAAIRTKQDLEASPCSFTNGLEFDLTCPEQVSVLIVLDTRNLERGVTLAALEALTKNSTAAERVSAPNTVKIESFRLVAKEGPAN